ncbi:MAG: tetratricopeptide repeat protein [Amylibacter sp.]
MALSVDQLLSKAKSLARKGDINTAAQIYKSVLQRFPQNKRAIDGIRTLQKHPPAPAVSASQPPQNQINALIALLQQGQLEQLVQNATAMTRNFPNAIALYDLLGIAHMGLQNYDQCIVCYQKALQIKPDFIEAYNNLGAALKAQGHFDLAIEYYHKALQIRPNYAEAHNNLGIAQQGKGNFDAAAESFKDALEIKPNYTEAHLNLGSALKEMGLLSEAIASFKKGLSITPNNAEAQNHLGNTQQMQGAIEDAIKSYKKALQIKPDLAEAYLNLGSVLLAQGHSDDALANYKTALKFKPDYAKAYRHYASITKLKTEDDYTTRIPELLKAKTISQNDRMHLSYALSKVKLDLGQHEEAIIHLQTANTLRKEELNYDISIDEELFNDIKNVFSTKNTHVSVGTFEDKQKTIPIFILGMPRSGTTLVEQIISSHSDVHDAGELRFMDQIMDNLDWRGGHLNPDTINNIRAEYYNNISALNIDQPFVTDKMPANFRWLGFISRAFPEAKIVHVNRNPAAVCWSNYKLYFPANGMRYSFDIEDIAHYYGLYQNLMQFWHGIFPNRVYDLAYETLTENQLEETQKLLTYLELDWQDAVMDFHKNTRSVATASSQQVRTKMYKGSSQEWERYKEHLGPMLKILNGLPKS